MSNASLAPSRDRFRRSKKMPSFAGPRPASFVSTARSMDNASPDPCLVCDGTGWKAIEREGVRSVVRCDCFERARLDNLFARAGVPPRYEACSFESFNGLDGTPTVAAKSMLIKFVEEYPVAGPRLVDSWSLWRGENPSGGCSLRSLVYRREAERYLLRFPRAASEKSKIPTMRSRKARRWKFLNLCWRARFSCWMISVPSVQPSGFVTRSPTFSTLATTEN